LGGTKTKNANLPIPFLGQRKKKKPGVNVISEVAPPRRGGGRNVSSKIRKKPFRK